MKIFVFLGQEYPVFGIFALKEFRKELLALSKKCKEPFICWPGTIHKIYDDKKIHANVIEWLARNDGYGRNETWKYLRTTTIEDKEWEPDTNIGIATQLERKFTLREEQVKKVSKQIDLAMKQLDEIERDYKSSLAKTLTEYQPHCKAPSPLPSNFRQFSCKSREASAAE